MEDTSFFGCKGCEQRPTCKKLCEPMEALLPKPRSGGHKKEKSVDPVIFDKLIPDIANVRNKLGGRKKKAVKYNDSWEIE